MIMCLVAACGGGTSSPAPASAAATDLGVVDVTLELGGGRDSGLFRQNDDPGSECGLRVAGAIAVANDGHVEVTDENHTIVGRSTVLSGKLVANSVITQPGGALVGMRCDFHFTIEIAGRPEFMTFVFTWNRAAGEVTVNATGDEVKDGKLSLETFLG